MYINLEAAELHAVQAYSENKIQINFISYESSLIVSKDQLITDLPIKDMSEVDENYINLLVQFNPEIIIIGHKEPGKLLPVALMNQCIQQGIGIEAMSLGAACRTFYAQ